MNLLAESQALRDWLNAIRQDFYRHPEPSWEERRTQGIILEFLKGEGIAGAACAGTGVVGLIRGGQAGPTMGLRADIDAVKGVCDGKAAPYRSQRENAAHSCGHDGHTAILMGRRPAADRSRGE